MTRFLITANSPGEMAGWVKPILNRWRERELGPVDILLLPCSFATGQEERVASSLEGVERIYRPSDYFKLLLKYGRDYKTGHLLHLGGDLMYSALLSWRWGISSWSYLWARPWWDSAFQGYFTKDKWGIEWLKKRKVTENKIHLIGDLVLDSIRQRIAQPAEKRLAQVSYLPGSRREELSLLTPFFLECHRRISQRFPGTKGILHLSPYLPPEEISTLLTQPPDPAVGGIKGLVEGQYLKAPGVELLLSGADNHQHLAHSELAVSIPGTKTAEAGYLRTPTITILPLNKPEYLPSIGLLGLLDFVPGGRYLKGKLLLRMKDKLSFLAHPNILAQEALLPEYVENIEVDSLSSRIGDIFANKKRLLEVRQTLETLYSWDNRPSAELVNIITASFQSESNF